MPDGGPRPSHRYARAGDYRATLTVTDDERCSETRVYTGQTAHCNGSEAAVAARTVSIGAAGQGAAGSPDRPEGGEGGADEDAEGEDDEESADDDGGVRGDEGSTGGGELPFTGLALLTLPAAGAVGAGVSG